MAADTIKLPAIGKVNRNVVIAAGAVGAGVVGYAWWTRGSSESIPEEVVTETELDAVGDERIPTTGVPYDPNFGARDTGITTNGEWSQFATDRLGSLGYDPIAVGDALGRFLDHQPLTPAEANIARAALAQAGQPPQGGPWNVLTQQPVASVGMTAPILASSAPLWRSGAWEYTLSWAPVQGAARYWVQHVGGSTGFFTTTSIKTRAGPGRTDTWKVAAVNAAGVKGPEATFSKMMPLPPGGTTTGGRPTPPGFVSLTKTGRSTYNINFVPAAGATSYRFRRIVGGRGSAWSTGRPVMGTGRYAGTAHIRASAVFSRPTRFTVGIVAVNAQGQSAESRSRNSITLP